MWLVIMLRLYVLTSSSEIGANLIGELSQDKGQRDVAAVKSTQVF